MPDRLNLVTGATGFTGSYLIRELLDDGQHVVGTDLEDQLETARTDESIDGIGLDLDHPNLELVPSDLLDPNTLEPLFERPITHVFHPASLYDYSASLEKLRAVNVDGTRNLLGFAVSADLDRFVHWSTCGVFGKPYTAADGKKCNIPFTEEDPSPKNSGYDSSSPDGTHLVNDYSVSKWEQEQMIWRAHEQQDLPVTVIRPAPIYGPGSAYGHGGIILSIAQGLLPAIPADAKNHITTSVHVEDVVRFACYIAEEQEGIGEDYNLADNSIISYHEFLHYIALLTGQNLYDIPLISTGTLKPLFEFGASFWNWLEKSFGVPRVRVFEIQSSTYVSSSYWISNRKSLRTGFDYKYSDIKEGLKDTVSWMRKMGWLNDPSKVFVVSPDGSKPS